MPSSFDAMRASWKKTYETYVNDYNASNGYTNEFVLVCPNNANIYIVCSVQAQALSLSSASTPLMAQAEPPLDGLRLRQRPANVD